METKINPDMSFPLLWGKKIVCEITGLNKYVHHFLLEHVAELWINELKLKLKPVTQFMLKSNYHTPVRKEMIQIKT